MAYKWQAFQSYQGSIFTRKCLFLLFFSFLLSILSRFYFYWKMTRSLLRPKQSFNPIKVLFLPFPFVLVFVLLRFQSYQGSIFTEFTSSPSGGTSPLSILSRFYFYWRMLWMLCQVSSAFNPIKVLFLLISYILITFILYYFQSYQGSIFTFFVRVSN